MVASQRDDQVRSQIPRRVGQDRFRHRVTSEDLSVSGSARRRLLAQLNTGNLAEVHRLDFVNRSRRRLVAERLRVKRAAQTRKNAERSWSAASATTAQQQQQQQRGGAPASADHGQGQGQPEGGKKKQPKETPPPRP